MAGLSSVIEQVINREDWQNVGVRDTLLKGFVSPKVDYIELAIASE